MYKNIYSSKLTCTKKIIKVHGLKRLYWLLSGLRHQKKYMKKHDIWNNMLCELITNCQHLNFGLALNQSSTAMHAFNFRWGNITKT